MATPEFIADEVPNPQVSVWREIENGEESHHLVIDGKDCGQFDIFDDGLCVQIYWVEKEKELRRTSLLDLSYSGISKHFRRQLVEAVQDPEGNLV